MRGFSFMPSNDIRHAEERPQGASRSTRNLDAAQLALVGRISCLMLLVPILAGRGGRPAPPPQPRNVLGEPLAECCSNPLTGFYRTGSCETGPEDFGVHT